MSDPKTPRPLPTRRSFLRACGVAAGAVLGARLGGLELLPAAAARTALAPRTRPLPYAPAVSAGARPAMVIDVVKCIGCRKCAHACVRENSVGRGSGFAWISLHRMQRGSFDIAHSTVDYSEAADPRWWYLPAACMQCENPPCVLACPVNATWREPDGIVLVDYERCTGCRYCIVNCPYGARHFNWRRPVVPPAERNPQVPVRPIGVVEKCTFCVHRTRRGLQPACVDACPVGARSFGDLADPASNVSYLLGHRFTVRLKEDLGTEPRVYYVG